MPTSPETREKVGMWLYFGCGPRENGHYLYTPDGNKLHRYGQPGPDYQRNLIFDGNLCPQPESESVLYQASVTRLGGWGLSALSWWDRSADKRGASNSTIFAPAIEIEPSAFIDQAHQKFPWVFNRLPTPLILWRPTS